MYEVANINGLNKIGSLHKQFNKKLNALYKRHCSNVECVFSYAIFCVHIGFKPIRGPPVLVCNFLISNQKTGGFL